MRREDRLSLLEKLMAAPQVLARIFTVPVSLRLLDDYDAVVAEAREACGHTITTDAVPLLDGSHEDWAEYAPRHQARLIAIGQAHMDAVSERQRTAAEQAAKHPPKPQRKPPPKPFVHVPSVFDTRA